MSVLAVREGLTVTEWLYGYREDLCGLSDAELDRQAYEVAALPGRLGDELRRLVDAEREFRQAGVVDERDGNPAGLREEENR